MSDKTDFLLRYGKNGVHYDYEHEFRKALNEKVVGPSLYKHPLFSEKHLNEFVNSDPKVGHPHTFNLLQYSRGKGILTKHHIETLFDNKSDTDKRDVAKLPGTYLSPRIGHWMFDNGNIYDKTNAVKMHPSVARKVLDDIASSDNPDHVHPSSVWQTAIQNKDAVTQNDLDIAKKSGHSMIKYTASIQ